MKLELIDSHCHIQMPAFAADANAVLGQAREQGIGMIAVGTNLRTSTDAVRFAEAAGEGVWAAVAVHPGHVYRPHHSPDELVQPPREESFDSAAFAALAASAKVVAIGEVGLDYYRLPADTPAEEALAKSRQRENFLSHIVFARERGLPLVLHVRDAHEDAWRILRENGGTSLPCAMHCFTGTVTEAERYLELGYFISFTAAVTYPPKKNQAENPLWPVVRMVPLERLLIETDAPWLPPAPLRGQRNEPANVKAVAEAVARLKGLSYAEIAENTLDNTCRFFNLAKPRRS